MQMAGKLLNKRWHEQPTGVLGWNLDRSARFRAQLLPSMPRVRNDIVNMPIGGHDIHYLGYRRLHAVPGHCEERGLRQSLHLKIPVLDMISERL